MMHLHEFGAVVYCPKCGSSTAGAKVHYSVEEVVETGSTEFPFVSVQTVSGERHPHLQKSCPNCRFSWLERTKDGEKEPVCVQ